MLQLYDVNRNKIKGLTAYKDYCIESVLKTGDKTLSFLYPKRLGKEIKTEGYIRNKVDEFVIKSVSGNGDWLTVNASLNVEDLEGKEWESFTSVEQPIEKCLDLACVDTGWTANVTGVTKKRTVRMSNCNSWDIIQQARKTYLVEVKFDTINKIIIVKEKQGQDKGTYFIEDLNLKNLDTSSDSYDFFTRIKPIGKDGLKINVNGKDYLENYQYSEKVKTLIWKDERYTVVGSLREDAEAKLEELSKPRISYAADIIDLAKLNDKYKSILDYNLGDVIYLVSKENNIREKHRIVKTKEYPDEPEKNSCEIANTIFTFEDIQKEYADTTDTVNNITSDNGTVSEGAISKAVEHLTVNKVEMNEFTAVKGRVGNLEVNKLDVDVANIKFAEIDTAIAKKIEVTDLTAGNIKFEVAEGGTLNLQTLLSKFITGENGQFLNLTTDNVVISNAVIKDTIAANISVQDLKAGNIDANRFNIVGTNGNLLIKDNTIQIKDANRTRVQIGKDAANDYNMYVWDSTGKLMFDATGLKADGIKSKIIRDDMISDTANINGSKINISSLITEVNKDTNTQVIKASKIAFDSTGQSLEVSFNSLKSNVDSKESRNYIRNGNALTNSYFSFLGIEEVEGKRCFYQTHKGTGERYITTSRYNLEELAGKTVTISFLAKQTSNLSESEVFILSRKKGSTKEWDYAPSKKFIYSTEKLIKYTWVYTFPSDIDSFYIRWDNNGSNDGLDAKLWITDTKLEVGENSNPIYSQAPEDVNSKIEANTTAIEANIKGIETLVKNTTIEKDGQNIQLKDAYTNFTQEYNEFKLNVSNTYTTKTETSALGNLISQSKQNIRCNDLGAKINYSTFTTPNQGEIYLHGFDSNNNPSDVNGTIYWNGKNITVPKGMIDPNSDHGIGGDIYLFMNVTNQSVVMGAWYDSTIKSWKYKMLIGGTSTGTLNPTSEHVAIGIINMKDAESFNYAYLFETPQSLKALTVGSMDILTRMNSAELKITDSAIISTVQGTINNAKTEAIDSANSSTDNKLKSYPTTTAMNTAITQSVNGVKIDVSNTYATKTALGQTTTRVESIEQNITATAITNKVSESISGTGKVENSVMKFDKTGLEVNHSNASTKTKLNAYGLYILDENGETIASLASKKSWTELNADKVFANNIENIYEGAANLYVDHNSNNIIRDGSITYPFTSFYQLKMHLVKAPILNKDVTVNVVTNGTVNEQLELWGLKGSGALRINLNKNFVMRVYSAANYCMQFDYISIPIFINGGRTSYNTNDGAYLQGAINGITFYACKYAHVELICIDTQTYGIVFGQTNGRTEFVDLCGTPVGIRNNGANVFDHSSCGNCITNYSCTSAGVLMYGGSGEWYKPQGYVGEDGGKTFDLGNRYSRSSFRTKPPVPPTMDTYQSFSYTDYGYYSDLYGNWNPNGKSIYQGNWGYGNNRGVFTFNNTSISSFLANATVLDGSTITLQRENAGGYSGPQTVYLYGTTHTSAGGSAPPATKYYTGLGTLAWGESKTFNLPKSFVQDLKSGLIKSVMLYTDDGSNYIKFSPVCTLRLKVNK